MCWILRVLYIFWITALYHICLLKIFYPSLWLVFILWTWSFTEQKCLILMKVQLLNFLSWLHLWYYNWETQGHINFILLSSMSFKVFLFIFRSVIHFDFIFVKGVKSVHRLILFIYCAWMSSCSNASCWWDGLCSTILPFLLCQNQFMTFMGTYFGDLCSVSLIYLFIL